jgi:hypothetical protein
MIAPGRFIQGDKIMSSQHLKKAVKRALVESRLVAEFHELELGFSTLETRENGDYSIDDSVLVWFHSVKLHLLD